jgi:hypothetical protein
MSRVDLLRSLGKNTKHNCSELAFSLKNWYEPCLSRVFSSSAIRANPKPKPLVYLCRLTCRRFGLAIVQDKRKLTFAGCQKNIWIR